MDIDNRQNNNVKIILIILNYFKNILLMITKLHYKIKLHILVE